MLANRFAINTNTYAKKKSNYQKGVCKRYIQAYSHKCCEVERTRTKVLRSMIASSQLSNF